MDLIFGIFHHFQHISHAFQLSTVQEWAQQQSGKAVGESARNLAVTPDIFLTHVQPRH